GEAPTPKALPNWAHSMLAERIVAYCKLGGRFKGADGSIGVEDVGFFKPKNRGMAQTFILVYSPSEVAVLGKTTCSRLEPTLVAHEFWSMY
ncbi:MAG TPA: hypothetical protein VD867_01210, partial [Burkholderiales bacterium]|nr:hypothetical protein [Burkholderiales bacterium]